MHLSFLHYEERLSDGDGQLNNHCHLRSGLRTLGEAKSHKSGEVNVFMTRMTRIFVTNSVTLNMRQSQVKSCKI